MAERRMFAKTIIDSDAFLDMPVTSQLLYFHLSMRADDDGFINKPKTIIRMCGCKEDDMKVLITKKFIIPFESGIVVIKHWKIHNYIAKDRYNETKYKEEKNLLQLDENKSYTNCIQPVYEMTTQVRLGKDRLGKDRLGEDRLGKGEKETNLSLFQKLKSGYNLSGVMHDKIIDWLKYKTERKDIYQETGLKSLLSQIQKKVNEYGDEAVCELIEESMANGWKGIIFGKLTETQQNKNVVEIAHDYFAKKHFLGQQSNSTELDKFYGMAAKFGNEGEEGD